MPTLVLASTSAARRELLSRLGLAFECVDPAVDERLYEQPGVAPWTLATTLAIKKAEAVAALRPGTWVLGADQVAEVDGLALGKPGTVDRAVEQLLRLQGRTHRLWTGVALVGPTGTRTALDRQELRMRPFDKGVARRYVAVEDVVACAGSYRIEGRGIALFETMNSGDWTGIIGLPLLTVSSLLVSVGIDPLSVDGPGGEPRGSGVTSRQPA